MICDHPETVIDHTAETVVEECVECGEVLQTVEDDEETEPQLCLFPSSPEGCQRRVVDADDVCWQHETFTCDWCGVEHDGAQAHSRGPDVLCETCANLP